MTPGAIRNQIDRLVGYLIEENLADDQNVAIKDGKDPVVITFPKADCVSHALRNIPYSEVRRGVSLKLINVSEHSPDGEARHWSDRTPWRDTIVREVSMRTRSVGSARASVE